MNREQHPQLLVRHDGRIQPLSPNSVERRDCSYTLSTNHVVKGSEQIRRECGVCRRSPITDTFPFMLCLPSPERFVPGSGGKMHAGENPHADSHVHMPNVRSSH